ncbi:MAG: methylenetetrahydrofolate reductase [NAD(P)H] [Gammaproteobacteria bacterium]|nr:methylenetetrahydrofolate reductase [NAD(P)H] [Gammaproteobacteria bacterium]
MTTEAVFNGRFSFEFFPPKTDKGTEKLRQVREQLATRNPDFFSVTYGAGGSTRDKTFSTVKEVKQAGYQVAPHLSFGGDDSDAVLELLTQYQQQGINRIVALRGDLPSGVGPQAHLVYASELVAFIKKHFGDAFHLEVACYPESHPDSANMDKDLEYFKQKVDAGADSAITQYFYNADAYFYYLERTQKLGIDIPIYAGIMPITNFASLQRFSNMCGAEIPRWIGKQLEAYGDDLESVKAFGLDVVTDLCETLLEGGAPGMHFYTMNQVEPTLSIWDNLGLNNVTPA